MEHTIVAKDFVRLARSASTRFPAKEKSWQGGPPIIISGEYFLINSIALVVSDKSILWTGCLKFYS